MSKINMLNNKSAVLFMLCLTSFLVPYMGSSLNLALPELAQAFNLDAKKLGWVNSAFLIATAAFQVPFAKISDLVGRKKVFLFGVALFGISSIACACAWNFASLITFRAFAGLGSAMIFGTNLAILSATYESGERGRAMGVLTSVVYMALAVGPFFGGILTHYFGWKSVFCIPGAVLVAQAISVPFFIKREWVEDSSKHFDKRGSIIYGLAVFCLIFGFSELPDMFAFIFVLAGILLFVFFYNYEKRREEPVFYVRLFGGNKVFTLASLTTLFSYTATAAAYFMLSLYLQFVRGFDARHAGLVLVSSAVVQSIAALFAGRLADKFEPSRIAMLGMSLSAIGLLGLVFAEIDSSIFAIVAMLLLLGLGAGLFGSPNTKVIIGSVERRHISLASATVGTMRLAGQAFSMGIAMMSISLFIGDSLITPSNFENFMQSWKFTFAICAILCIASVCTSQACSIRNSNGKFDVYLPQIKLVLGVAVIALLFYLAPNDSASNPSVLVGHWLHESGSTDKKPEDMELFKDGTGVCDSSSISWKVENKRFVIQSSSIRMASDYEVSGYRLTLTNNAEKATYVNINKYYQPKGIFTDSSDGKKYETIRIGAQTWLAENLNHYVDGSKCYDDEPANCQRYGRLYNWETALNACPKGWHLPSDVEWQNIAGRNIAGKKLKARSGWDNDGNGTDFYGFSALPGGRGDSSGNFRNAGLYGYWWSATEDNANNAYFRGMDCGYSYVSKYYEDKSVLFSVRCVQDSL